MDAPAFKFRALFILAVALLAAGPVYSASTTLHVGGAEIEVRIADDDYRVSRTQILEWVREAARAVASYYGQFPVDELSVNIESRSGGGIGGRTFGWKRTINASIGRQATARDLEEDWVMTHEMVHMGFPQVTDAHKWAKEGLAVYVQRIARARSGDLNPVAAWADLKRDLPQGLPRRGDRGLDHTPTWGRVYWGGAMFYWLADILIRARTDNRYGLQDALRAIVAAGGTLDHRWSIERAFRVGDRAVGVPVLTDLYERMKDQPIAPDLEAIWNKLGVEQTYTGVVLHDDAPLAHIRRAIVGVRKVAARSDG